MTQAPTAPPTRVIDTESCPVRDVLAKVAGKWSILIIVAAAEGPVRFTELERRIEGVSRRMLTLTLRTLERDGLLERTAYPTIPPRVEYRLTDIGEELYEILVTMTGWAQRHKHRIGAARTTFDETYGGVLGDTFIP